MTYQLLLFDANAGDQGKQFQLAQCYATGDRTLKIKKNPEQAFEWFTKAAAQGHVDAIIAASECYENGKGTANCPRLAAEFLAKLPVVEPEQQQKIFQLIDKAYQDKDQAALPLLATVYEKGWGTPVDFFQAAQYAYSAADARLESYTRSFMLYQQVSEQHPNYAHACYQLALLCTGNFPNIEKQPIQAVIYCQQAADRGDRSALFWLAIRHLGEEPFPSEIACIPQQGIDYLQQVIALNPSDTIAANAYYQLGTWQTNGHTKRDLEDAQRIDYYQKAADLNHRIALEKLVDLYTLGTTQFHPDLQKAEHTVEAILKHNPKDRWAKTRQGMLCLRKAIGKNNEKDKNHALNCIMNNVQSNDAQTAQFLYNLGIDCLTDQQLNKIYNKLLPYARNANNPSEFKLLIGFYLKQGRGTPKDLKQARELLGQAAQQNKDACHQIRLLDQLSQKIEPVDATPIDNLIFNPQSEEAHNLRLSNPETSIELCRESLSFFERVLDKATSEKATTIIASAHYGIALYHLSSQERPNQNIETGWQHLVQAANDGNRNANYSAAQLYRSGEFTEKNNIKYLQHLKKVREIEPNDLETIYEIGEANYHGIGTQPNPKEAAPYYKIVYEQWPVINGQKRLHSGYQLASIYHVNGQKKQFYALFKKLADEGFYPAIISYANLMKGNIEKNSDCYHTAKAYYLKALQINSLPENDWDTNKQIDYIKNKLIELEACKTYADIKQVLKSHKSKETTDVLLKNINTNLPKKLQLILDTINACYISREPTEFVMTVDRYNQLEKQLQWLQTSKSMLSSSDTKKKLTAPIIQTIDNCLPPLQNSLEAAKQYALESNSNTAEAEPIIATAEPAMLATAMAALNIEECSASSTQIIANLSESTNTQQLLSAQLPQI